MTDTSIQSNTKPIERKELTLRVVVLGLLLAVVMGGSECLCWPARRHDRIRLNTSSRHGYAAV